MQWILDQLKEASVWRGLVALLTSFGLVISPDQGEAIIASGLGVIGLLGAFFSDKKQIKAVIAEEKAKE